MTLLARLRTLCLCLLSTSGVLSEATAADTDLHHAVRLEGRGSHTVIMEAGLGDTLDVWKDVQAKIAADCTRTFSYNRAGYLGSDPATESRDSATVVTELRAELKRRNIDPPYVLVGHSLGGLYMQYFARNYPKEVAGLLLVDSTHWHQGLAVDASANTPYMGRTAVTLFMPWIMRREIADSVLAGQQVHASPEVHDLPTIVLSSTRGPQGESGADRAQAESLQNDIAADFPGSEHIQVADSGHYIQRDHPAAVVDAARKLAGCTPHP